MLFRERCYEVEAIEAWVFLLHLLLAELGEDDAFDRASAASSDKLARLAREALAEHRAGGRHSENANSLLHPLPNRLAFDQANGAAVGGLGD